MSPDGANSTGNTTATDHSAMDAVPDVHDRITEAYFGQMGDELGRSSRERIHWICSHATGARVLDVGCSQGISANLLGREGKIVTGVDVARRSSSSPPTGPVPTPTGSTSASGSSGPTTASASPSPDGRSPGPARSGPGDSVVVVSVTTSRRQ